MKPTTTPTNFTLPESVIEAIKTHCKLTGVKISAFMSNTLQEYTDDRLKLANAVAKRILVGGADVDSNALRFTHRVPSAAIASLRKTAKECYLPVDGLTRILFEDKLADVSTHTQPQPQGEQK